MNLISTHSRTIITTTRYKSNVNDKINSLHFCFKIILTIFGWSLFCTLCFINSHPRFGMSQCVNFHIFDLNLLRNALQRRLDGTWISRWCDFYVIFLIFIFHGRSLMIASVPRDIVWIVLDSIKMRKFSRSMNMSVDCCLSLSLSHTLCILSIAFKMYNFLILFRAQHFFFVQLLVSAKCFAHLNVALHHVMI